MSPKSSAQPCEKISAEKKSPENDVPTKFAAHIEEAVAITGYGRFNFIFMGILIFALACQSFVTTEMAYVLPAAECELHLTPLRKGWLNAAMYGGMITTAFLWGAISDSLGRRSLLVFAFAALAVTGAVASQVTDFWVMLVARVVAGALIIGPVGIIMTYAAELHGKQYRSRLVMWTGMFQSMANIMQAVMAMLIIPQQWEFMASWRLFLLMTSVPAMMSALLFLWLPESPKFLLSKGRQKEAIDVLKRLYSTNTGKRPDLFPVKTVWMRMNYGEKHPKGQTAAESGGRRKSLRPIQVVARQFYSLSHKPHLVPMLFSISIQFLLLFCNNSVRMWVPQIFSQMELWEQQEQQALVTGLPGVDPAQRQQHLCAILEATRSTQTEAHIEECIPRVISASVYLNSVVVGTAQSLTHLGTGILIRWTGNKPILATAMAFASAASVGLLWAENSTTVLVLACIFQASTSNSYSAVMNVLVELFPTSVRSSAVSLSNISGRLGSLLGNLLFPMLLTAWCSAAFGLAGAMLAVSAIVGIFVPPPIPLPPIPHGAEPPDSCASSPPEAPAAAATGTGTAEPKV